MSNTNLVLGANWRLDEWPEFIAVSHEGTCDGMRLYYPERTCTCEGSIFDEGLGEFVHDLSCGHTAYTHFRDCPNYCDECGAKVVSE